MFILNSNVGATNSHFYKEISPPPSPTTGERRQHNEPQDPQELDSPPLKHFNRPASANSHHFINNNTMGPLKRIGSLSTEDILLVQSTAKDVDSVDSFIFSSLPLHSHSGEFCLFVCLFVCYFILKYFQANRNIVFLSIIWVFCLFPY